MRLILEVTSGPSEGRMIPLQAGEIARFGRSDFADVCFPGDADMAEVHFELQCELNGCSLRDVAGDGQTLLNEKPVSESKFDNGDVIVAGQTRLLATIEGMILREDQPAVSPATQETQAEEQKGAPLAIDFCQSLDLEEGSLRLLHPGMSVAAFVEELTNNEQFPDAIRVLSIFLPKHEAIAWAHHSVQLASTRELPAADQAAMDSVKTFLNEPNEENRRAAHAAAEATDFTSGASWVALAVFWSEGSIAREGLPVVEPDEQLCGQAVSGSLLMTATSGDPTRINDRYRKILEIGLEKVTASA